MPDDDLTPTDEQVRRLLAEARHTEPIPDDVAARLDGVLAGLREDPDVVPTPAPARDDLAAARRRRNVRNLLVAAAAIVVVGVGVNQLDPSGIGSADSGDDSAASAGRSAVTESAPDAAAQDAQDAPAAPTATAAVPGRWRGARVDLSPQRFGKQVATFQRSTGLTAALSSTGDEIRRTDGEAYDYSPVCDVGDLGAGRLVPVRYDDERAWLVFRKVQGDSQVVDLYLCGSDRPTRSITLPAP